MSSKEPESRSSVAIEYAVAPASAKHSVREFWRVGCGEISRKQV